MTGPPKYAPSSVLAGRYVLESVLGSGGMATVWSAHDRRLGRAVAVKILRSDLSSEHAGRIEREARAAARIDDPRVVTVLDLDHDDDGTPFLVLEALSGRTLADELVVGALDLERVTRLAADLLGGLSSAHAVGVLHRDIKPSNVLLAGDGFRITDFGIANIADEEPTSGDLMGTVAYLAPERFDGASATPQTDVFAAGVVLYEALAGVQPFRGDSTVDSVARLRSGRFDPLASSVPAWLAEPISLALDHDPSRRPDAAVFAAAVTAAAQAPTEPIGPHFLTQPIEIHDRTEPIEIHEPTEVIGVQSLAGMVDDVGDVGHDPGPASPPEKVRRSKTIVLGVAGLLFVVLAVALAGRGGDSGMDPVGDDDPAAQLDQQLERLAELGR